MKQFSAILFLIVVLLSCQIVQKADKVSDLIDTVSIETNDTATVGNNCYTVFFDSIHFNGYGLKAIIANKTYNLIDTSEHLYIQLIKEMDFDLDGNMDVLLAYSESGFGNCCGSEYFFVSYLGNGIFKQTAKTTDAFNHPEIEEWNGSESIVVQTTNMGVNNDDYVEINNRYILKQGVLLKVEETRPVELKAIKEIRAKEFSFDKQDEIHKRTFDLDNDGKLDTIICSFWHRWGSINWEIAFATGKSYKSDVGCKRLGILETKTNNVCDLVVDLNTILKWSEEGYK